MLARSTLRMTADEFFRRYEGLEGRYELVRGEVVAMAGGSIAHAAVKTGLIRLLGNKLLGASCQVFDSDTGLSVAHDTVRYPDAAIYCDRRDLDSDFTRTRSFRYPSVVFEVLSPSTEADDRGYKLVEYKALASVEAIVLIDPVARSVEVHERVSATDWLHRLLPPEAPLVLEKRGLVLTSEELFARL